MAENKTPVEALRDRLPNTVAVRVLNALEWAGIRYVEELDGMAWPDLFALNHRGERRGAMGRKSVDALITARDETLKKLSCSFCSKPQTKVKFLVAGPYGVNICSECVGVCVDLFGWRILKVAQ